MSAERAKEKKKIRDECEREQYKKIKCSVN